MNLSQVYLDQALFAPGIIGFYFTSMTLLEGNPFSKAIERLEKVRFSSPLDHIVTLPP